MRISYEITPQVNANRTHWTEISIDSGSEVGAVRQRYLPNVTEFYDAMWRT